MAFISNSRQSPTEKVESAPDVLGDVRAKSSYKVLRALLGTAAAFSILLCLAVAFGVLKAPGIRYVETVLALAGAAVAVLVVIAGHQAVSTVIDIADLALARETRERRSHE